MNNAASKSKTRSIDGVTVIEDATKSRTEIRTAANGLFVWGSRIIGTNRTVYGAWEPSSYMGNHRCITTTDGGQTLGQVGTRRIGSEIEALPGGSGDRIIACEKHRMAQVEEAQAAIASAFPAAMRYGVLDGSFAYQIVVDD